MAGVIHLVMIYQLGNYKMANRKRKSIPTSIHQEYTQCTDVAGYLVKMTDNTIVLEVHPRFSGNYVGAKCETYEFRLTDIQNMTICPKFKKTGKQQVYMTLKSNRIAVIDGIKEERVLKSGMH